jgi:hypothetical protein
MLEAITQFVPVGSAIFGLVYPLLQAHSVKRALERPGFGPTISVNEFSIHPLSAILFSVITSGGGS